MTLPLSNTAEGGSNTVTVTGGVGGNSGGASGDYFDTVSIGAGEALTFSTTTAANGSTSYVFTTAATTVADYFQWDAQLGTLTTNQAMKVVWYWRVPGVPTSGPRMMSILNGSTLLVQVYQDSTGQVAVIASGTIQTPGTVTALAANTWYRIEATLTGIGGGATAGEYAVSVYQGNTNTLQGNAITGTGKNFGTLAPDTVRFGITTANGTPSTSHQLDDPSVTLPGATSDRPLRRFPLGV